jgi:DNA-binding NtrC family response regulator
VASGQTLLLVDDDDAARTITGIILRGAGYKVIEATSAEEALNVFAEHRREIQLVVSDIVMPGMHGTELAQRLMALQPGLGVVLVSGYTWSLPEALMQNSCVAFVEKPFRATELVAEIAKLLAHTAGSHESPATPSIASDTVRLSGR